MIMITAGMPGCSLENDEKLNSVSSVVENCELSFAKTMADRDFEAFKRFIDPEAIFFKGSDPLRGSEEIFEA